MKQKSKKTLIFDDFINKKTLAIDIVLWSLYVMQRMYTYDF